MEAEGKSIFYAKKVAQRKDPQKKHYIAPLLTVYGTLNDITGGIGTPIRVDTPGHRGSN
jgi:hypothetical protein